MIIVATAESAEQALTAGTMRCPRGGCVGTLARWGYGRRRRIRGLEGAVIDARPGGCAATGAGPPRSCCRLHCSHAAPTPPKSSASRWRAKPRDWDTGGSPPRWVVRRRPCVGGVAAPVTAGHLNWLWQRGAQELIRLDADAFNQLTGTGNLLRDALAMLRRRGLVDPPAPGYC